MKVPRLSELPKVGKRKPLLRLTVGSAISNAGTQARGTPRNSNRARSKRTVLVSPFQMIFCALMFQTGGLSGFSLQGSHAV